MIKNHIISLLVSGSIYTVMQLVAVLLISSPSSDDLEGNIPLVTSATDEHDEEILYQNDAANNPTPVVQPELEVNLEPSQIIKTHEFWILWTTFVLNTQAVGYINSMYKAFGQTFIHDDHFLAIVGAFAPLPPHRHPD